MAVQDHRQAQKGRGAVSNPEGRFETQQCEPVDDGWLTQAQETPRLPTRLHVDAARSIIARNDSPDIAFTQSINPYRGCEHGCIYCYARPSHGYLNLSAGLDFETELFYKPQAAALLEAELRKSSYRCAPIELGSNTDPYQPVERELGITRSLLELMLRFRQPARVTTKGAALLARDLDLLAALARQRLLSVAVSITTLDAQLKRTLEPRAASPQARLRAMRLLHEAGVPVMVNFSPVIPFVNDAEMEAVLEAARQAGAQQASYIPLRLPYEVKDLFRQWLDVHLPQKAAHVMSLVQQMRGGRDNDPRFGSRMRGEGEYAEVLRQRFALACRRLGLDTGARISLDCSRFAPPPQSGEQMGLDF
ncbi:DNA repair photolyase [Solimonas aquatica]|uniref:DNA repair photolyase n=1 Tax=Solimonas aquatica TaxID=489703 RepID=A0A1H9I3W6_9GAMM|nr:PA0069 family radical SAM protein [Solimonas aquatica]SEQ69256.1 DNA repair photolyase [Solimonas aquatica]